MNSTWWHPIAVFLVVAIAVGIRFIPKMRGFQFTAWIIAAVACPMFYPEYFLHLGPIDLQNPWIFLFIVQAVMFGMGTQMSLTDFAGVIKMPYGVLVGIVCQFTIMPLVGYTLTLTFELPVEIAAGIVLIGSCSSGLASNVMVFLSRGNLALSITLTSIATLMAPLMTPLWMKWLGGQLVEVSFAGMMLTIIKIVIVPVGAALLYDYLKQCTHTSRRIVAGTAVTGILWMLPLIFGGWNWLSANAAEGMMIYIELIGFLLGAVVVGFGYYNLTLRFQSVDNYMPAASMFGIIYFTAVTTAAGRDDLIKVGAVLFLAAVLHNGLGYCLGYALSRAMKLNRTDSRTVAFEVGLQNGAMATGIAQSLNMLATMGLASAIFSPWMNVSGSVLANYWKKHPPK